MPKQLSDQLTDNFSVSVKIPVAWGEMDAFGHVNNTVYFRYFESARIAYFEKIGVLPLMEKHKIGPILAYTECKFRIPLTFPDVIEAGARVVEIAEDRFLMEYGVFSEKAEAIAAEGSGRVVYVDYNSGKKSAIPAAIRDAICLLEDRDFDA